MKIGTILSKCGIATAVAACLLNLNACKKPVAEESPELEPAPAPAVAPATPVPASPVAVAATPAPDPLAPPGVFFLLQKISITTDDGIVGLKPGQMLRQIAPGSYSVDGHTVALRDDQVTNNLRISGQLAVADQSAQAALRQAVQARMAPPTAAAPKTAVQPSPAPVASKPQTAAVNRPSQPTSPLGSGALGAAHTRTSDGWLWQKSPDGKSWVRVRPLNQ